VSDLFPAASESAPLPVGSHQVRFRRVGAGDRTFLERLYASTREPELAPLPWSAEEKQRFIVQQFTAQDHAYRQNYPGAEFLILVVDGADAGRLYLHRRSDEIRIMDIALLPPFRNRGIGTAVLHRVIAEGRTLGRAVTIHVEVFNPALRLYERLGFRQVSATDVYALMELRP
jgi:GNAT superfamily N-acetyltransferase